MFLADLEKSLEANPNAAKTWYRWQGKHHQDDCDIDEQKRLFSLYMRHGKCSKRTDPKWMLRKVWGRGIYREFFANAEKREANAEMVEILRAKSKVYFAWRRV